MTTIVPWFALSLSAVALILSLVLRSKRANRGAEDFGRIQSVAAALSQECDRLEDNLPKLGTAFAGLREMLARLEAKQSTKPESPEEDDAFEVNPRFVRFIDLQRAWEKSTGKELTGPAIADGRTIDELTEPDSRQLSAQEAELKFTVAARRVVEYLVHASGTGVVSVDAEQIGKLLEEMAGLVGLKLIDPPRGQRPDRQLHDSVGTVPAGVHPRGTIAKVEVRGLVRGNGSVLKAKVYLYD